MPKTVPLNPCDYCTYAQERLDRAHLGPANLLCMVIELDGRPRPEVMRRRVVRLMSEHPIILADLCCTRFRIRPYWRLPADPCGAAQRVADQAFTHLELGEDEAEDERFSALCHDSGIDGWDGIRGPQVRFILFYMPGGRARLVIRWPHYFADAEGGHMIVERLDDRWHDDAAEVERTHMPDARSRAGNGSALVTSERVLRHISFWQRASLVVRGAKAAPELKKRAIRPLTSGPRFRKTTSDTASGDYRFITHHWGGDDVARIVEWSKAETPKGFGGFSRFLATSVVRAQHRLYGELNLRTDAYVLTFPISIRACPPEMRLIEQRPMAGNYIVSPTLVCSAADAGDRRRVAEVIHAQIEAFLRVDGIRAQWAALEAVALIHHRHYSWLFKFAAMPGNFTTGYSYFGGVETPPRAFDGARVVNIWGASPTTSPPGINPIFGRFGGHLNLSVTYNRPEISDDLARRYLGLIAEEVGAPN